MMPAFIHALTPVRNNVVLSAYGKIFSFDPSKLVFIECTDKLIQLHFRNGETETLRYKIGDAQQELAPFGFIRSHKGYLVNFRYIFSIEKEEIVLDSLQRLPLSRQRYKNVKEEFARLNMMS